MISLYQEHRKTVKFSRQVVDDIYLRSVKRRNRMVLRIAFANNILEKASIKKGDRVDVLYDPETCLMILRKSDKGLRLKQNNMRCYVDFNFKISHEHITVTKTSILDGAIHFVIEGKSC